MDHMLSGSISAPEDTRGHPALAALGRSGGVRLIDSLVVTKAADGSIRAAELVDFDHLEDVVSDADAAKLMGAEDAEEAAELIGPGYSAPGPLGD